MVVVVVLVECFDWCVVVVYGGECVGELVVVVGYLVDVCVVVYVFVE